MLLLDIQSNDNRVVVGDYLMDKSELLRESEKRKRRIKLKFIKGG